jgi:hypothetical protein
MFFRHYTGTICVRACACAPSAFAVVVER